jgi:hypothetical protein
MVVIGGYEDSLKRLGVQSWQAAGAGAAPSYHFDMLQVLAPIRSTVYAPVGARLWGHSMIMSRRRHSLPD